jgi:hypothetical protein
MPSSFTGCLHYSSLMNAGNEKLQNFLVMGSFWKTFEYHRRLWKQFKAKKITGN